MSTTALNHRWTYWVGPVFFLVVAYLYFYPLLAGQEVQQHDRDQWQGTARELLDYRAAHPGEQSLWTNTVFSGMPATLISLEYPHNVITPLDKFLTLGKRPASYIFLTMLGFYLLLLVLRVDPWLALAGAVAYGFSTYFFIIIGAGHNAKSHAICYAAPMVASVILAYRGHKLLGGVCFGLMLALSLVTGHPQITYYTLFVVAAVALVFFIQAFKSHAQRTFWLASLALILGAGLAVGANFNRLYQTWDYGRESIRGTSELHASTPDATGGLDRAYALDWSYGIAETLNLGVPNLFGGSSSYALSSTSATADFFRPHVANQKQLEQYLAHMPTYWGPQPMTSGPVYLGASVIFLFVLVLFFLKGPKKWVMLGLGLLAIMLSWGKHFPWLSNLFLDYFPGYNKFRSVSMTLFIVELIVPLLAFYGLSLWQRQEVTAAHFRRAFRWSVILCAGGLLLVLLVGSLGFSFSSPNDAAMGLPPALLDALQQDRKSLLVRDVFRTLLFVALPAGLLFAQYRGWLKWLSASLLLALVVLLDLGLVNTRYDGVRYVPSAQNATPFQMTAADRAILQDTSFYRVFNTTVSPFNDASTSFFHNSVGGYHGAKLRRYQEFYTAYANTPLFLNLLNVKYVIQRSEQYGAVPAINPHAYGNAWFVDSLVVVATADEELASLDKLPLTRVAVLQEKELPSGKASAVSAPGDTIYLTSHAANELRYQVQLEKPRVAVFSEIYYPRGWQASIASADQALPTPEIFRCDYILRGILLPAGRYALTMHFDQPIFYRAQLVDAVCGWLLVAALLALLVWRGYGQLRQRKPNVSPQPARP